MLLQFTIVVIVQHSVPHILTNLIHAQELLNQTVQINGGVQNTATSSTTARNLTYTQRKEKEYKRVEVGHAN